MKDPQGRTRKTLRVEIADKLAHWELELPAQARMGVLPGDAITAEDVAYLRHQLAELDDGFPSVNRVACAVDHQEAVWEDEVFHRRK